MSRVKASVVAGVVVLAVGLMAAPAVADDTTATFIVVAGTLDITVPGTASIGTGAPGTTVDGALGVVTVTDQRASADASWTAFVTSTNCSTGGGIAPQVTLAPEIDYWSGAATFTSGTGTFTPGQATYANRASLSTGTPLTAFAHGGGTGNNTASWQAALSIRAPQDSVAGTCTGTVTHSVA